MGAPASIMRGDDLGIEFISDAGFTCYPRHFDIGIDIEPEDDSEVEWMLRDAQENFEAADEAFRVVQAAAAVAAVAQAAALQQAAEENAASLP